MGPTAGQRAENATIDPYAHFVQGPGLDRLRRGFDRCAPWSDERRVARELRALADELGWKLPPGGEDDVAHAMRCEAPAWAPSDWPGMAWSMLHNVAKGREPTDMDDLRDHIHGPPASTLRDYRRKHRAGALHAYLQGVQYRMDLAALVRGGRTVAAARRWLERHPGEHAKDAPAPRPHSPTPGVAPCGSIGKGTSHTPREA